MWPLRIAWSRLRPINPAAVARIAIVAAIAALFIWGDFVLFKRMFEATKRVEEATPFFALAILRNLLSMVFLVASVILFSSALTAAIGAFFTDLDLDIYQATPQPKVRIVLSRWLKTLLQSATVVFVFLIPLFVAFARENPQPKSFYAVMLTNLALLLTIPVTLASLTIVILVRWFPVRRVHQIVATLAMLVLTLAVIAFRASRPERLFSEIATDDLVTVLRTIELPSMSIYPGTALAEVMVDPEQSRFPRRIFLLAIVLLAAFTAIATPIYFTAFVRARESMAPVALGATAVTRWFDRLLARARPTIRAMIAKEIRTLSRDVAQWSQIFLMAALLFIYLYNIRLLPLGGDTRATMVAYLNLGMAGFVVAAICLRFAYPSVSSEGKAFWIMQAAPVSYRELLLVKVLVYSAPLTLVALLLTTFANVILEANAIVWTFTLLGSSMLAITLVSLGVGMGGLAPNFNIENPLQVGLSLGGFAYMAVSMAYVGGMMIIMARPVMSFFFWRVFGIGHDRAWISIATPIALAVTVSALLAFIPLLIAERRLADLSQSS
jgi:ABC-2 type transport system permease protein